MEPETYLALYKAAADGDEREAARRQERINRIVDEVVLSGPCFVAGPKYVLSRLGIGRGVPVSPLQPADEAQARRIDRFLAAGRRLTVSDGARYGFTKILIGPDKTTTVRRPA